MDDKGTWIFGIMNLVRVQCEAEYNLSEYKIEQKKNRLQNINIQ